MAHDPLEGRRMTRHDLRLLFRAVAFAGALGAALVTVAELLFGDPDAGV